MSDQDLKLYKLLKFIEKCETRDVGKQEIIIWVTFDKLKEYTSLVGSGYFDEGDEEVTLLDNSIAFDIVPVIEAFGMDYEDLIEMMEDKNEI